MCSGSASGVLEAHGTTRCGRAAPIGLVEVYELIIFRCLRQQMHVVLITRTWSFSAAAAPGSALMCFQSASGVPEAHGIARCGRAASIGRVEGYELIILVSTTTEMHEVLIPRISSFSAAAAPGSALMCFQSAFGVPVAHGIARCGRAAPIVLVEGSELILLVSATTARARGADPDNFGIFGSSSP